MSRRESFELTRPDGVVIVIDRDIDTGEQTATPKVEVEVFLSVERTAVPGEALPIVPSDPSIEQVVLDDEPAGIPIPVKRRTKAPIPGATE